MWLSGRRLRTFDDRMMRDLQVNLIELHEQSDFTAKKQRHVKQGDRYEWTSVEPTQFRGG
jgi:hypothetical protein